MKIRNAIAGLTLAAMLTLHAPLLAQTVVTPGDLSRATTEFALDLYRSVNDGEQINLFLSPYSAHIVLSLLYAGAKGSTAEQMADALGAGPDPEAFHSAMVDQRDLLVSIGEAGDVELSVANSLWPQSGSTINPEFLELADRYGSEVNAVNYRRGAAADRARDEINAWGARNTNNRIRRIISTDLPRDTYLLLANAIFFKGDWARQFDPKSTTDSPFHTMDGSTASVRMMQQLGRFRYGESDEAELLELPYVGGNLSMLIALPREQLGLPELERSLSAEEIGSWDEEMYDALVEVSLPRFRITSSFDLVQHEDLANLGIVDALSPGPADFTDMINNPSFYIRLFAQMTFVEVTEEGTEAAAVTAGGGCFPAGTLVRTADGDVPIERIVPGTAVRAFDDQRGTWVDASVSVNDSYRFSGDMIRVTTSGGSVEATWNHPFLVASGTGLVTRPRPADLSAGEDISTPHGRWVEADDLAVGDRLVSMQGPLSVTGLSARHEGTVVYSLEVEDLHTFAVGSPGIVVHNGGEKESAAEAIVPFIADHPFLFFIRETSSGTILFMGRVGNPPQ